MGTPLPDWRCWCGARFVTQSELMQHQEMTHALTGRPEVDEGPAPG